MLHNFFILILFLISHTLFANDLNEDKKSIQNIIEAQIKRSKVNKKRLSLIVENEKGDLLYGLEENKSMVPASLTKIFTAGAVLEKFSPTHQFITELWVDKNKKQNLYLKGGGDPSFVSEKLWYLVNKFILSGIKTIDGDIIVDDSLFDDDFYPGRSKIRVDRAYDAPISAMSFNWNAVTVHLVPDKKETKKLNVFIDPPNEYIKILNKGRVGGKSSVAVSRSENKKNNRIFVSGVVPAYKNKVTVYKSITNPSLWAGYNLKEFLKQRGIKVLGEIRQGNLANDCSENCSLVASSKSKPLADIIKDLMKFSNNYVAEMLTKNMSLQQTENEGKKQLQGNISGGLEFIRNFIVDQGIDSDKFTIVNPSGLSRKNQFTVKQINKTLKSIHKRFDISPEFIASLPVAGIDGTLKRRMKSGKSKRWVRAKTGLLSGVVGLAGFAGRKSGANQGEILTFSFLYNGPTGTEDKVRKLFDDIIVGIL